MDRNELEAAIKEMADCCEREGVDLDDSPGGAICQWALRNVNMRPGTEFFVVFLIAYEMGKRKRLKTAQ